MTARIPADANAPAEGAKGQPFGGELAAQRRQISVLFCDLVGSTELSARLDPEEMRDLIADFHRACATQVEATGGFLAKYLGDGVLAYFGYPTAHEDDAERAIRAGRAAVEAVSRLQTPTGEALAARVGIATGVVVVGDLIGHGWSQERSVVGETPNLAARLQGLAPPGGVVAADVTRRLAAGGFEFRDLGPVQLKGLTLRDPVWEVVGEKRLADRFLARRLSPPAELVGREAELDLVLDLWRGRANGDPQVVGFVGEPGIGKSRLLYEVRRRIAREPHVWIEGGGAPLFANTPFHAIGQMVLRLLARRGHRRPAELVHALERSLRAADMDVAASLPVIGSLIDAPVADASFQALDPEHRRAALISALTEWLLRTARHWPTVVAVEDLHWVDPSSLELLTRLIEGGAGTGLLLLYTSRTASAAPWPLNVGHRQLALDRLEPRALRRLIEGAHPDLAPLLAEAAIARSGGVPLFAEELARLFAERDAGAADRAIPAQLSDLLMERLDRLGDAKPVAQIAAVLGPRISPPLIAAVSGMGVSEVERALEQLAIGDILIPVAETAEPAYAFRHALVQDAAYEALLKSQRRDIHHRAAVALAERFPEVALAHPEVMAQHWSAAGEHDRALAAWRAAGHSAQARRAFKEAEAAYVRALEILKSRPASTERDGRELALQSSLAGVLQITRGYSAVETIYAAGRARELAEAGGDLRRQVQLASAQWGALSTAGRHHSATRKADQVMELARMDGAPEALGHAHMVQLTSRYRIGDLVGAEDFFHQGEAYFRLPRLVSRAGFSAQAFGNAAQVAWLLGRPNDALIRMKAALELSRSVSNPFDEAFAQFMDSMLAVIMGRHADAAAAARASLELSETHGFSQFAHVARVTLGRGLAGSGLPLEGLGWIEEGLRLRAEAEERSGEPLFRCWLAEIRRVLNDEDGAVATIEEALGANPQELAFRPTILQLRGDLRLARGDAEGAESDYLEAMALARTMRAKVFYDAAVERLESLAGAQLEVS
ncbi:MAG TPA: adenylate/guanylate cyclase domain-containing protein [Caulobacteraceae bacterium]|jgi:class 3 adenylate cyclase/tetratricopeptide (TPR) repeat protein